MRRGKDGKESSVPCYEQYNHHFTGFMHSSGVEQALPEEVKHPVKGPHGAPLPVWKPIGASLQAAAGNATTCPFSGMWINPANGITVNMTGGGRAVQKYQCSQCQHVYDPAADGKGMPFESLPATWKCPVCGAPKSAYKPMQATDGTTVWAHTEHTEEHANATGVPFNATCVGTVGWHQGYGMVYPPTANESQGSLALAAHDDPTVHTKGRFDTAEAEGAPRCSTIRFEDGSPLRFSDPM